MHQCVKPMSYIRDIKLGRLCIAILSRTWFTLTGYVIITGVNADVNEFGPSHLLRSWGGHVG